MYAILNIRTAPFIYVIFMKYLQVVSLDIMEMIVQVSVNIPVMAISATKSANVP